MLTGGLEVSFSIYKKCLNPRIFPYFSEAQVLTILWASSLSLPFYLKVDRTWNNVASDAIFISLFCLLLGPPRLNWWPSFALDFQRCCLAVQGMISTCQASHWISWVLSLASSWCWNVIYLFTVVINWWIRGYHAKQTTIIMFCNTSETYPTKSWKLPQ